MVKKAPAPFVPSLPFEEPDAATPLPPGETTSGRTGEALALPVSAPPRAPEPVSPAFLAALREQIIRDSRVLREDPVYHMPNRAFYEERIETFRSYLRELEQRAE